MVATMRIVGPFMLLLILLLTSTLAAYAQSISAALVGLVMADGTAGFATAVAITTFAITFALSAALGFFVATTIFEARQKSPPRRF